MSPNRVLVLSRGVLPGLRRLQPVEPLGGIRAITGLREKEIQRIALQRTEYLRPPLFLPVRAKGKWLPERRKLGYGWGNYSQYLCRACNVSDFATFLISVYPQNHSLPIIWNQQKQHNISEP